MDKRILISAPIHNRAWILPYYLRNIYNLQYNKKLLDLYFIVNNSTDKSFKMLKEFEKLHKNEYNSIIIEIYNSQNKFKDNRSKIERLVINNKTKQIYKETVEETRSEKTYLWLSELRNKMLKKCLQLNCDFLWSVDSDILVRKDSLQRLLSHNKNIVASLIYNSYHKTPDEPWKFSNILKLKNLNSREYEHICNFKVKNPDKNPIGTLISCEFTGACILISKDVCKIARYEDNKVYGEDEPFCYSARKAGHSLWCDVSLFNQHVMSPSLLEQFKDFGI